VFGPGVLWVPEVFGPGVVVPTFGSVAVVPALPVVWVLELGVVVVLGLVVVVERLVDVTLGLLVVVPTLPLVPAPVWVLVVPAAPPLVLLPVCAKANAELRAAARTIPPIDVRLIRSS
jgi:hypothetical protein